MKSDTVSVIVPVYNVESYLATCVNSLLKQTYKNLEIILVDDGSKDNSGKICELLKAKDSRIEVIHKRNEGLGLSRNAGLERAKGKYVTFVDSDDYLKPKAIEKLVEAATRNCADICIGGFTRVDNKGNELFLEKYTQQVICNKSRSKNVFARMLGSLPESHESLKMSVWNCLYSLELIKRYHLQFASERKLISEDIIWHSDYFKYVNTSVIIDSELYCYRENGNSLTKSYNSKRFKLSMDLYFELMRRIRTMGLGKEAELRNKKQFFINIRTCIAQEKNRSLKEAILDINKITSDQKLTQIISSYPISQLELKQKIFLLMLKHKLSVVLALLSRSSFI